MASRLTMDGLDELRAELRGIPEKLTTRAGDIVVSHASAAKMEIELGYPVGPTGNLRRRVSLSRTQSKVSARAKLTSRAPHAHLVEDGTNVRRTRKGWNRGRMPQAPDVQRMIPKAIRARRRMVDELVVMVKDAGFEVTE